MVDYKIYYNSLTDRYGLSVSKDEIYYLLNGMNDIKQYHSKEELEELEEILGYEFAFNEGKKSWLIRDTGQYDGKDWIEEGEYQDGFIESVKQLIDIKL